MSSRSVSPRGLSQLNSRILSTPIARVFQWMASSLSYDGASRSILPFVPRPIKWFLLLVLLANFRSWPGVWHIRVFEPVIRIRLSALFRKRGDDASWWLGVAPVGRTIFPAADGTDPGALSVLKCWAAPDDCDWNGHLSNSSYAKNLDPARMQACMDWFTAFLVDGGWCALGGAHYHYIREIPINTSYEIRVTLGGWDDKWFYLVAKFVSHPKQNSKSKSLAGTKTSRPTGTIIPIITTPSTPLLSELSTPGEPSVIAPMTGHPLDAARVDTELSLKPVLRTHDHDGALIHCIAVSTYVFKHGRITVPPKVAFAVSGFSLTEAGDKSNWTTASAMRAQKPSPVRELLRGGWKEVENKFWEPSPEVEAERVKRVMSLKQLTTGMDSLRVY